MQGQAEKLLDAFSWGEASVREAGRCLERTLSSGTVLCRYPHDIVYYLSYYAMHTEHTNFMYDQRIYKIP